jgi:hypothetical protein
LIRQIRGILDKLHFRTSLSKGIPYLKFDIFQELDVDLKEIVLGPKLDFKKEKYALELLLRKYGFENVKIAPSKIPFC